MGDAVRKVVIAGAGQAGASAAVELRRAGFDGEVVLVGDEAHAPYERPQLSKDLLRPGNVAVRSMRDAQAYQHDGIRLELGRKIRLIDADNRHVKLEDGTQFEYDRLLIATGVRPRTLPVADDGRVRYLRNVEDAMRLRQDMDEGHAIAVVGGGVIGLEVAAAANARGNRVAVIESADRLMTRSVDPRVSRFLDRTHRARGVDIRYGVQALGFDGDGMLSLSDGSRVRADRLLVGIGVVPNVEAVAHLGITDEAGVRVDNCGRTAIEHIYATGDVASQPCGRGFGRVETWANAQDHAVSVVRNLLGEQIPYESPTWFWSDQGQTNLQVVGNATEGRAVVRGDEESEAFSVFWLDEQNRVTGSAAVNSPKDMAMARRWVKQGARVEPQRLCDPTINLHECQA